MTENNESTVQQGFLSYFWDLALPDIEKREQATRSLVEYLKKDESDAQEADFPGCSRDLIYTVKRLAKGLLSFRDCSRQGFALALTIILQEFPQVPTKSVKQVMYANYEIKSSMKHQEERDVIFARIFGYLVLIRSKRFLQDETILPFMLKSLNIMMVRNTYVSEIAIYTYILILQQLPKDIVLSVFLPSLATMFKDNKLTASLGLYSLFTYIQYYIHTKDITIDTTQQTLSIYMKDLYNEQSLKECVNMFRGSCHFYPKMNSIWCNVSSYMLSQDLTTCFNISMTRDLDSESNSLKEQERDSIQLNIDSDIYIDNINIEFIKRFITIVIQPMLTSSAQLKASATKYICMLLPHVPTSLLQYVLTRPVVKCFYACAIKKDEYMNDIALYALKLIKYEGLRSVTRSVEVINILIDSCSLFMDKFLHINILNDLIASLSSVYIQEYITYIIRVFVNPILGKSSFAFGKNPLNDSHGNDEDLDLNTPIDPLYNEKKRQWCFDTLLAVSQYKIMRQDKELCKIILSFFIHIAFCPIYTTDNKEPELSLTMDSLHNYITTYFPVPLVPATITIARQKFNSYCSYLNGNDVTERKGQQLELDNIWLYTCIRIYTSIRDQYKTMNNKEEEEEEEDVNLYIDQPIEGEEKLFEIVEAFLKKENKNKNEYILIKMLLNIYICVLMDIEDEDIHISLTDGIVCYEHMYMNQNTNTENEEESPVSVLVDLCTSLLIYNNKTLRVVLNQVFTSICSQITESQLIEMSSILLENEKKEDKEEEEVEENNDSDIDSDDSDSSSDDDSDSDDSDDDEEKEEKEENNKSDSEEEEEEEEEDSDSDDDDSDSSDDDDDEEEEEEEEDNDNEKKVIDDDDDELWKQGLSQEDIDQMNRYDDKIRSYLTIKKQIKKDALSEKQKTMNYKLKILDLLELYIDKNAENPNLVCLVSILAQVFALFMKDNKETAILDKLKHIYKGKLCRTKLRLPKDASKETIIDYTERCYNGLYTCILLCLKTPKDSYISHEIVEYVCFGINYYFNFLSLYLDINKNFEENRNNYIDIQRLREMFDLCLYDYFQRKKSHLKLYFFKYTTARYPILVHFLLPSLAKYTLHAKTKYTQYEAISTINMIIKNRNMYNQNKNSIYIKTCFSFLCDTYHLIQKVLENKKSDENKDMTKGIRIKQLNLFMKNYNIYVPLLGLTLDMDEFLKQRESVDMSLPANIDINKIAKELEKEEEEEEGHVVEDDEDNNDNEEEEEKEKKEKKNKKQNKKNKKNNNKNKKEEEKKEEKPVMVIEPVKQEKKAETATKETPKAVKDQNETNTKTTIVENKKKSKKTKKN